MNYFDDKNLFLGLYFLTGYFALHGVEVYDRHVLAGIVFSVVFFAVSSKVGEVLKELPWTSFYLPLIAYLLSDSGTPQHRLVLLH